MSKILVVDDDQELRENIMEILNTEGFDVRAAANGEEALDLFRETPFDLMLLDLIMPKMGGMEVLSRIKREHPGVKVIMITAYSTVDNAVEAMKKGADDYITKPFKINELSMAVKKNLAEAEFLACKTILDMDNTFSCLANSMRRQILVLVNQEGKIRFMDITRKLGVADHTKVNFHLKVLKEANLIEQDSKKLYLIAKEGKKVLDCLNVVMKNLAD
ncbi:MAG: response regulator [Desulfobulbaceae bacterium]|nr:response regulator [Desulfobulbaceae bacterium]